MYIQEEEPINSLSITHVSANVKTKCLWIRSKSGREGGRQLIHYAISIQKYSTRLSVRSSQAIMYRVLIGPLLFSTS